MPSDALSLLLFDNASGADDNFVKETIVSFPCQHWKNMN